MLAIIRQGKIEPLETINLPEGTKLLVTPLSGSPTLEEQTDWYHLSGQGLNLAYGEDEPEYTLENIKEYNTDYEAE
jgi:hypothetical protein